MSRDWDYTWEHWRDMTPEERAVVSAEINEGMAAAGVALRQAMEAATRAINDFAKAYLAAFSEPVTTPVTTTEVPKPLPKP